MNERLTPQREAEIAAAVAELDADRALSFGTWTAIPVTEKTTLPPEQAFAVEDVARLGNATIRGSVGVFGDQRHAAFTALARDAVPALLAELAAVRAERDAFRDQRNNVFATNAQLHDKVTETFEARLRAENETRTVKREFAEAAATVARLVQERGERMKVENALRDEVEELRARVAELDKRSAWLSALEAAGVDSWEGYDDAREIADGAVS